MVVTNGKAIKMTPKSVMGGGGKNTSAVFGAGPIPQATSEGKSSAPNHYQNKPTKKTKFYC